MTALNLLVVALATGAIIDAWRTGSIFATWRAIVQAKQDVAKSGTFTAWWTELLNCSFCQSYHIPFYLFTLLLAGEYFAGMFGVMCELVVYSLAATRVFNISQQLLPEKIYAGNKHEYRQ